ncbi:hypothetical protein, partial [Herbaspirillum sp. YR522]|uniref:hypothetical protein n=1 Tax=Herbaspirillum sp. YR522 TaxID=1144342 RepID=UPI001EE67F95
MRQLFAQVEELIGRSEKWGDAVKAKASMGFRRRMTEMIKEGEFAESLRRHSTYYRTKLTGKHLPRPILSPELGDLKMPEDAPIDAFPHTNAIDLKNKIKKRLDEDVRTILDACVSDLRSWQKIRQQLLELARIERSDIEMDNAINFLNGGQYERERSLQNFYEKGIFRPERFLSAASKICTESLHWARIKEIKVIGKSVHSLAMVRALDPNEFVVRNVHFGHVILMALRAHFLELANAFIILLIHTGWNAASLRSLTRPRVREAASGYLIQGFKGKTGKDTPEVFLDKSHRGAIEAIELMLWNHQNLKQRGLISPDDMQLWHMWPKAGVIHQMGSLDEPIRLLGEKYGVKRFTLDQIRSHMLVRLAVRHGTAEAAPVAAG